MAEHKVDWMRWAYTLASQKSGPNPMDIYVWGHMKSLVRETFYRKEIVKIVFESLDKQLTANITVLTAILLIDKAWGAVTPITILNCFKKSGFLKENFSILMDYEESAVEPLVDISGVSFSDFVQVDDDVAVSCELTDGEILSATDTNEKSNDEDEDDTSEPLTEMSVKEA
ncbi:tigger transposable element-derived protein 6-like [Bombyx mandarina]|uniref:Tigger transposable element-derived protein 6-like n=1 Tax=Bombyx mandarina TaxID=7092 RepID=A0A6J2K217_BOMMA|nr:tigger transposable element-derived protein 6-like [Bombyx mandarina]